MAVRQAALVSEESALEACLRRCAIQIDDLYLFYLPSTILVKKTYNLIIFVGGLYRPMQVNVFLIRLSGEPIGFTVLGIFVIDKNTILTVYLRRTNDIIVVRVDPQSEFCKKI